MDEIENDINVFIKAVLAVLIVAVTFFGVVTLIAQIKIWVG